ncbi:hypothetical protein BZA77DRAFT_321559, partial [Pyronema omphalodes]
MLAVTVTVTVVAGCCFFTLEAFTLLVVVDGRLVDRSVCWLVFYFFFIHLVFGDLICVVDCC